MNISRFYAKEVVTGFLDAFINHDSINSSFVMRKMRKKWKNFLDWYHFINYNS